MSIKPHLHTIEDLIALPDDGKRYELHDGVIVEVGTSSRDHTQIGIRIIILLSQQIEINHLGGEVTGPDGTFELDATNTRVPDVAYISAEKAAKLSDDAVFYPFAPDLAVEIKSPSNSENDMRKLAELYLRTGSRLVWAFDYQKRNVKVYRPGQEPFDVTADGELEGYDVLPGLKIRVADIFKVLKSSHV
jgi:Uma2 family endonuclease